MEEDGRVAIAKVAFREKEHLAALRFKDNVFVLETMYWPDEIKAADFEVLDKKVEVRDTEVQMAKSLIDNLTEPFKPDQFQDEYREGLLEIVEKKVAGEEIEAVPEPEPTKVVDLMEALKASVEQTKKKAAPKKPRGSGDGGRPPSRIRFAAD
jgi:DNA end-binding protein Ku